MRHIHSDKTKVYTLYGMKERLLIVTDKIKRTFVFEDLIEGPLNQIKKLLLFLLNYGVMWYKESKNPKWTN